MTLQSTDTRPGSDSRSNSLRPSAPSGVPSTFLETVVTALLSIFVFALPTELHIYRDISVTLPVGFLCVALGALGVMKRQTIVGFSFGSWCLLAFVMWSTLTLAWADYPHLAMIKVIKYWEFLPMVFVITQYAWCHRVRMRLFDAYLAGCWCGVLGVFFNYASDVEATSREGTVLEGRYSFSADPNYLALALVIGICIAFYRAASNGPRWKQLIFSLYVPSALTAIVITGSRGALLALLGASVAFCICTTFRMRIALLSGAAVCLLLTVALPSDLTSRFATIPDELNHGTLSDRTQLWDRGKALVAEHPLQGRGVGAATGVLSIVAHNTPLELLIEGGLVSLVLFYGAFAHGMYRVWKIASQERTPFLVIIAAWLVGTSSLSWDVDTITWFIVAMLLSAGSAFESSRGMSRIGEALKVAAGN